LIDRRAFATGALALPLLAQSGILVAEVGKPRPWAIGFAPPVDAPLFCTTQTRVRSGRAEEVRLTVARRYQFEHLGRGFRLVSTLTDISDNAPPRLSRMLRVGIDPLIGLAIAFTIDASGRRVDVENLAETWSQVSAAMARIAASVDNSAQSGPLMQNVAAIDDASRRALLLNEVYDLIRYAGRGDVHGHGGEGDMVSVVEPVSGDWQLTGAVHVKSGLSWELIRSFVGATPPRHGIAGTNMQIRL
jgi:hypothetical protein